MECWKYGKTGHFKRDCRSGNKKNANASGSGKGSKDHSQDQGQNLVPVWNKFVKFSVSLISEAFYVHVDEIVWWLDFGATTHVCKDRCWFKTYEPVEDESVLYMGDDHFAPVYGKGSVVLEFSLGKSITLFNVLYVPKLRKNINSGPILNKCGYKQVYESDKYILSKCGVFVGFGYYNNGMFMLNLNKVPDDSDSVYMSSSTVVNSSLWHARLGHVHYKRMLEISKDELIHAIDENPDKCNKKYVITFIDDASRFCYVYLLHAKDEALDKIDKIEDIIEEDLRTYNEAMQSRDAAFWKEAINDEIGSIMENNTWVLSDIPPSCKPLGNEHKVCKLVKSLYGLKQAPKQWYQKFDEVVLSSGFLLNQSDKCVYSKFDDSGKGVIVCLYVDDMLIFGTDKNQVDKTKKFLSSRFSMKDMGEVDVILSIKIKRENKGIVITQSYYIEKIFKKFNLKDCSPVSTPIDTVEKLMLNTSKLVD
ncbi:zinc finger, CCHC-type containing protein [Tanacetum coccineum]